MRRAKVLCKTEVMAYLAAGGRGTRTAISKAIGRGSAAVAEHLRDLEAEGAARRVREQITMTCGRAIKVEELDVWEWAHPTKPEPLRTAPSHEDRAAVRRAAIWRARESMGALGAWAHGESVHA